jgi:hypothetical protein
MEKVTEILTNALKNLADHEVVAINAKTAKAIGLQVDAGTPDERPVEFSVSEIRAKLQPNAPIQDPDEDGADL